MPGAVSPPEEHMRQIAEARALLTTRGYRIKAIHRVDTPITTYEVTGYLAPRTVDQLLELARVHGWRP